MEYRTVVTIFVLSAVFAVAFSQNAQGGPHGSQGGPHQDQRRVRRQVQDDDDTDPRYVSWTTCDISTTPLLSCNDCNTRLICKPVGGILKPCLNPYRPYCNNGICSPVPSANCA